MRRMLIVLAMAFGLATSANAQIHVSIGINMSTYPDLVLVPGYPVYYDPQVDSNYFFYDGLYWLYEGDEWYASSWYNGPWDLVDAYDVPVFVLRVPVRYYRRPPVYFRGWLADAPPRWGEHWGRDWDTRRNGWDRWDRQSAPRPAPLPIYQRQYSGNRYPRALEQQRSIRSEQYRYDPRESVTRQHWEGQGNAARPRAEPQTRPPTQPQQQQPQRPQAQQQPQPQRPQAQQQPQPQRSQDQQPQRPQTQQQPQPQRSQAQQPQQQPQRPQTQQQPQPQRPKVQPQQQAQRPPGQPQQSQRPPAPPPQQTQRPRNESQGKREDAAAPKENGRQRDEGQRDKSHDKKDEERDQDRR